MEMRQRQDDQALQRRQTRAPERRWGRGSLQTATTRPNRKRRTFATRPKRREVWALLPRTDAEHPRAGSPAASEWADASAACWSKPPMPVGLQQEAALFGRSPEVVSEHSLIEELHLRLNLVWRYGECIAEAMGEPMVQGLWQSLRCEELAIIGRLRRQIADSMEQGVFQQGL